MTPEEAIEIQAKFFDQAACTLDAASAAAFQLGIEALERHRSNYLNPQCADFRRLPSETEK